MNPREQRLQDHGRRRDPPGRVRVTLGPADDPALTSVWAARADGDGGAAVFTLEHDYEDFTPAAGWCLVAGGEPFRVTAVNGRQLTCAAGAAAPAAEGGE